uniref:SLA1 homology domain-containing protein n=1 Tax=Schlesneria paludicola TaxID=360056 RepID=A0A7C4LKG0_9PLAN
MKTYGGPFWTALCAGLAAVGVAAAQQAPPQAPPRNELPIAPAAPRVQMTIGTSSGMTVTMSNGRRSATLREGDETIELKERDGGKEITLRHERKVNGELKKDEYQAPDLDTLKQQHPQAVELYRRIANRIQAIQIRPIGQVQGLGGNVIAPFAYPHNQNPPPGQGRRTIHATVQGKKVQISDRYGLQIEVAVTRMVDGKEQTEQFSAPDLAALKKNSPEVAELYQRLTGTN